MNNTRVLDRAGPSAPCPQGNRNAALSARKRPNAPLSPALAESRATRPRGLRCGRPKAHPAAAILVCHAGRAVSEGSATHTVQAGPRGAAHHVVSADAPGGNDGHAGAVLAEAVLPGRAGCRLAGAYAADLATAVSTLAEVPRAKRPTHSSSQLALDGPCPRNTNLVLFWL